MGRIFHIKNQWNILVIGNCYVNYQNYQNFMLLTSSDTKRTLMHLFLFTNSAQRELVSIRTHSIRNFPSIITLIHGIYKSTLLENSRISHNWCFDLVTDRLHIKMLYLNILNLEKQCCYHFYRGGGGLSPSALPTLFTSLREHLNRHPLMLNSRCQCRQKCKCKPKTKQIFSQKINVWL